MSPDVVYLAPKPFSRNRLVLHLLTVAAVVIALVLGVSVFFKVGEIRVSGASQYSEWEILQASGIQKGDNLLTFSRAKAAGKIQTALPFVKKVRIGIKLPDTVNIVIEEVQVTYAVKDASGNWWRISSNGKVIDQVAAGTEGKDTKIIGVLLKSPAVGQQAAALQEASTETDAEGNTVPITVTAEEKLKTAVDITAFLEQSGIIGEAASIDVNNLYDIQLWYGQRFQVKLGGTDQLSYKISCMKAAIGQFGDYESGVLDISNPDEIYYDPFS
ncbi:MAG: FtsQ-type POTRA domain-containing protein [Oscillospiraceae bacterium]|nr:FtsQ-type POTRA domain-containing protein [Oscillospiraceae bacterium]